MNREGYPIEGFYLETPERFFFAAKGVVQSPAKVFAVLRYIPHPQGDRIRGGEKFKRLYDFQEQEKFLESFPHYLFFDPFLGIRLQCVPRDLIKKVFDPREKLRELKNHAQDPLEEAVCDFANLLKSISGVPWENFGVSGSLLLSLHLPQSDLDLLVYGEEKSRRVYAALKEIFKSAKGELKALDEEDLVRLYRQRSQEPALSLEEFRRTEKGKVLQGRFRGREYFIRLVKEPWEIGEKYGEIKYSPAGKVKIRARVIDASQGIFTPCLYQIDRVKVLEGEKGEIPQEVFSFRGRYCEQATEGTEVLVRGNLERMDFQDGRVQFRVLLTGADDFFIPCP
ncbi:MAG: nucleotidyltransferase domain-containing protein [Caldiserica bacterium]|nr:nucleotidyltransferase domain-containing protein [Caldisericota bacterium]MDH7562020.1 nucleotidyltransferase domain-containing protein [Caldisericota bacterium]